MGVKYFRVLLGGQVCLRSIRVRLPSFFFPRAAAFVQVADIWSHKGKTK